jgi:prophage maintenance system killer protein
VERLSIEDLLLIAELVLDVPGEQLARAARLDAAHAALAAADRQPLLADRAAVLCHRLVRERPLPWGNKPVALLAMLELISRNHGVWISPRGGERELAATVERLAAGRLSERDFRAWVRAHVRLPAQA